MFRASTKRPMTRPKAYVGIDPGVTGCACLLAPDTIHFHNWDCIEKARDIVIKWDYEYHLSVILERQMNIPNARGSIAMAKKNLNFGNWEGIVKTLYIDCYIPTPQQWQKVVFQLKKRVKGMDTKQKAIDFVRRQFPAVQHIIYKKTDEHKADALCMAYYGKMRG